MYLHAMEFFYLQEVFDDDSYSVGSSSSYLSQVHIIIILEEGHDG